ncbi:molybdopterin-guanine dinucleotide biosynthesis protein B [Paenibacillus paridis]|uniref:molybdopterin-guanine dinucleotide biosynthesis protein B n=1 Tax=Paenibacillus paridis TaxID=2583376 RepID=UPI00111D21D8|nr:molybdopterin-guanine dinucleotide biosynthesis protein B [Paenibacillus paridis]
MQPPSARHQLVIQVVGYKNTGKTTLVCRLTERFKQAGYIVGTIKRDAHDFQIDKPGSDTWQHQAAGADLTAITSSKRTALLKAHPETLEQLIAQMDEADVILIEGFKTADYPKILILRTEADNELFDQLTNTAAIAYWPEAKISEISHNGIPAIPVDQTDQLLQLIMHDKTNR